MQLPYVLRELSATKPHGPVRMFVSAVQIAAGASYHELQATGRSALPATTVEQLVTEGHLTA